MRKVYRGIAWLIAGMVVVQAAVIALAFAGMMHFVDGGGVVDKGLTESRTLGNFSGEVGFPIHGLVGGVVLPIAVVLLLLVSWFTKVRGASWWAAGLFVLVGVQVTLGYSAADLPYIATLHGANAIAVLTVAVTTALRTRSATASRRHEPSTTDVSV